jgi:hypothetical protein
MQKYRRMSSRTGRNDQQFVKLFLSAHDQFSWRDAEIEWLDQQVEGAVEARATRRSDENTLAIEHTLIEPFREDKSDFTLFEQHLLPIEDDESLRVQGCGITVLCAGWNSERPKQEITKSCCRGRTRLDQRKSASSSRWQTSVSLPCAG